jgi:preprotein translocase subunit SecE
MKEELDLMASNLTETNGAATKKETPKTTGAARPATTARKDGPIQRLTRYLHEVRVELKKTTWPPRPELIAATKVVLGTVIVVGIYMGVLDFLMTTLTRQLGFFK